MENLVIEPLKGYGDIKFGMTVAEIVDIYGEPSNNEELDSLIEGDGNNSILYDYEDLGISLCFEGFSNKVLTSISTNDEDAILFGENVYEMNRNQIVELMKKNGYKDFEEEEQEGDTCLIYDELMLDFYFNEGKLIDVLWGVVLDTDGNIIK